MEIHGDPSIIHRRRYLLFRSRFYISACFNNLTVKRKMAMKRSLTKVKRIGTVGPFPVESFVVSF
jgi:hypothetical protein